MNPNAHATEGNKSKNIKEIKNKDVNNAQETIDLLGENVDKPKDKKKKKKKKREENPQLTNTEKQYDNVDTINNHLKQNSIQSKPEPKQKKKKDKQRRKPAPDPSFQIIINGRPVDLVRYDGFPVMKKDAERLQQLRQDMVKKGIPKKEVDRTMKLERRRAEKALARIKRDVCYNCRKGGHNLSDCPDLRAVIPDAGGRGEAGVGAGAEAETADGICFKCGSTEHRQSECRVQKGQQFRFASCFICKEQGHIARQCPDNPKGLYPNGGACKLCGDVTHLRKDCPTTKNEKEETSVRLDTLATSIDNVEDIPSANTINTSAAVAISDKKPKKIKF